MPRIASLVAASLLGVACNHEQPRPPGGDPQGGAIEVTLPQAVAGALWANPMVYPTVPLHVHAPGANVVRVQLGNQLVDAVATGDAEFTAALPLSGDGALTIDVTATGDTG